MTKSTVLTDPDEVALNVGPAPKGSPYAEDAVAIHSPGASTAWVSARELIAAIEKAAGLNLFIMDRAIYRSIYGADPEGHATPMVEGVFNEPKALWTEVRERPARAELESEQRRPLSADDITDEMVERGRSAYWGPTYGGSVDERVRAILTAALAPARPEGAEDWEDWLIEAMPHESMPDEDIALLADRIAQRLNEERS